MNLTSIPDDNYVVSDCYYYDDELLKSCKSAGKLSLLHVNVRSLNKNYGHLTDYLETLNTTWSVIALSETWSDDQICGLYKLPNYKDVVNNRKSKRGGGVSLYINSDIGFKERNDISSREDIFESLFVEIIREKQANIIIGVIYRPPGDRLTLFQDEFNRILTQITRENKIVYLLGDYNINLLNADGHLPTGCFLDSLTSHPLVPLIKQTH